jgi:hypothetical protein
MPYLRKKNFDGAAVGIREITVGSWRNEVRIIILSLLESTVLVENSACSYY